MKKSSACSVCIEANLLKKLTHNIYCAPEHYTSRLAIFYLSMLEQDYLPELNLSEFEKYYRAFNPIVLGFIAI